MAFSAASSGNVCTVQVPQASFGLSVDDILALPDKDLNQVVGLRRLAPYRAEHSKVRPNYKALQVIRKSQAEQEQPKKPWHDKWKGKNKGSSGDGNQQQHQAAETQQQPKKDKHWQASNGKQHALAGQKRKRVQGKQQQHHQQRHGSQKKHKPHANASEHYDAEARVKARQESYAALTLKKHGQDGDAAPAGKRKASVSTKLKASNKQAPQNGAGSASQAVDAGSNLTKAQRKNLKRALKRAGKGGAAAS